MSYNSGFEFLTSLDGRKTVQAIEIIKDEGLITEVNAHSGRCIVNPHAALDILDLIDFPVINQPLRTRVYLQTLGAEGTVPSTFSALNWHVDFETPDEAGQLVRPFEMIFYSSDHSTEFIEGVVPRFESNGTEIQNLGTVLQRNPVFGNYAIAKALKENQAKITSPEKGSVININKGSVHRMAPLPQREAVTRLVVEQYLLPT